MPVYVLFVSRRSGIVFNSSNGAMTEHCKPAKDIDPHFKFLLCVGPRPPKAGMSERTTEIFISAVDRDSNPQPLDRQLSVLPLSYRRSLLL